MLFEISAAINDDDRATTKVLIILKIAMARSNDKVKESDDDSLIFVLSIFDRISSLDRETIDAESRTSEIIPKLKQI